MKCQFFDCEKEANCIGDICSIDEPTIELCSCTEHVNHLMARQYFERRMYELRHSFSAKQIVYSDSQ